MIRRCEHSADKKFTLISRALAQNSKLSFQARGLLVYVLSKPSNWQAKNSDLMKEGGFGEKALASILRELKDAGYLRRRREQSKTGTFHYVTEIFEEPHPLEGGTAPSPPEPSVRKGGTAIDSTGARAGSSVDLTRPKEITPTGYKQPPKTPEPKTPQPPDDFEITNSMYVYLAERCISFTDAEIVSLTDSWRLARLADSEKKRTLEQWRYDWLRYLCSTWEKRSRNGHNGHREAVNDQPMKTLKERMGL